ncbi:Hypothetical predicted protein [Mytilus galloprovincialis]|uniref:Peptidase M60 domain-containing protein n=1 Tax=Mytilus galloprovincialis TaxID=29158 RepID=A0A8B6C8Q8_MYTGA|nr:Hypothetical predicted protein [Mytilus galloprovincialis]
MLLLKDKDTSHEDTLNGVKKDNRDERLENRNSGRIRKRIISRVCPGVIFVYGEKSQAILANKRGHALCAGAEYGKGRIIVFSHNAFVDSFGDKDTEQQNKRFNKNVRKWSSCSDKKNPEKRKMVEMGMKYLAKGIQEFSGTFEITPEIQSFTLDFSAQAHKWHSTGCYLPAGIVMEVSWRKSKKTWEIIIGIDGDELDDTHSELKRWPKIRIEKELKSDEFGTLLSTPLKICSPFVGLVYLQSPTSTKDKIQL